LDLGVTSSLYHQFYDPQYGYFGYFTSSAHVLLGDGRGGFAGPYNTELGNTQYSAAAATDFNGDGIDDFMTLERGYGVHLLLGDASGFLRVYDQFYTPDYPTSLAVADLNGDLKADLVTSNG